MNERSEIVIDIIDSLAKAEGVNAEDLEYTLYEHIDPSVLTRLTEMEAGAWTLTFQVGEHEVEINSRDELYIDGVPYKDSSTADTTEFL